MELNVDEIRKLSFEKAEEIWLAAIDNAKELIDQNIFKNASDGMDNLVLTSSAPNKIYSYTIGQSSQKIVITKGLYKILKQHYRSLGFKVRKSYLNTHIVISW